MALVHDLAESLVGDITPYCGVSKEEKRIRENKAIREIVQLLEDNQTTANEILDLFEEFEDGRIIRALFVIIMFCILYSKDPGSHLSS